MRRSIPSTTALTFFEAAARHRSYTRAAQELAVTQAAVCRQIAGLEDFLGVQLFERSGRGVALTEAGLGYAEQVRARLDEVERDTLSLMARGGQSATLELGVVPTFATCWLLPRLSRFIETHPGVQVHCTARTRPFLFEGTPFDAAIHAGQVPWAGTQGRVLMAEHLVPVCSPGMAPGSRPFRAADWRRVTLLQQSTRPYAWREWFTAQGLSVDGDMAGPRLELFSMLAEAAVHGLGVALVPPFVVQDALAARRLVQVTRDATPSGRFYHLLYPASKAGHPALMAFQRWLLSEAS